MAWDEERELWPGASNVNDDYVYDISQGQASRLADQIMDWVNRYGEGREEPAPFTVGRSSHRNRHLDGYGDPRR